jgi:hypothetical protein
LTSDERAAQAVELMRALRVQLLEMSTRLKWLDRQNDWLEQRHPSGRNARAAALRAEAATLRRDIKEAQVYIERLRLRYLPLSDSYPRRS